MGFFLLASTVPGWAQFGKIGKPAAGPEFLVYIFSEYNLPVPIKFSGFPSMKIFFRWH
jgi:hypothetical protein